MILTFNKKTGIFFNRDANENITSLQGFITKREVEYTTFDHKNVYKLVGNEIISSRTGEGRSIDDFYKFRKVYNIKNPRNKIRYQEVLYIKRSNQESVRMYIPYPNYLGLWAWLDERKALQEDYRQCEIILKTKNMDETNPYWTVFFELGKSIFSDNPIIKYQKELLNKSEIGETGEVLDLRMQETQKIKILIFGQCLLTFNQMTDLSKKILEDGGFTFNDKEIECEFEGIGNYEEINTKGGGSYISKMLNGKYQAVLFGKHPHSFRGGSEYISKMSNKNILYFPDLTAPERLPSISKTNFQNYLREILQKYCYMS